MTGAKRSGNRVQRSECRPPRTGIGFNGQRQRRGPWAWLRPAVQERQTFSPGSTGGWATQASPTTTTNCLSGIRIGATASRRSASNRTSPCGIGAAAAQPLNGGRIRVQGNNNSLRWNETSGNGYATGPANKFSISIFATANSNLVEANTAIGNSNGIVVFPGAGGNAVRQNVVVGNPPIQVSNSVPAGGGVDIWDQSASGTNSLVGNFCVTGINAPCPVVHRRRFPGNLRHDAHGGSCELTAV